MGVPGLSEGRAPGSGRPLDAGRTLDAGRQPGRTAFAGTYSPSKVARNFPRSVFDVPRKRWNCNDPISKFEGLFGELRATFLGNHAGVRVCGVSRPARGLQGLAGLRDRSLRAEGSRVAISRAGRRPRAHTAARPWPRAHTAARRLHEHITRPRPVTRPRPRE